MAVARAVRMMLFAVAATPGSVEARCWGTFCNVATRWDSGVSLSVEIRLLARCNSAAGALVTKRADLPLQVRCAAYNGTLALAVCQPR